MDESRSRPEFLDGVLEDLEWLGLDWNGEAERQTDLQERHQQALSALTNAGLAYPCICTRKDIERAASAPHQEDWGTPYPGTCRGRFADATAAWTATGKEPSWRFDTSAEGVIRWKDELIGEQSIDLPALSGDFVIWTKAGRAAYQLAVVVDDAASGVTQVVRGKDLIPSTFQQVALIQALGLARPNWWHVGLVCDPSGNRLAKRAGSLSLDNLRKRGIDPQEIVSWAAESFGMHPAKGLAGQYVSHFDWGLTQNTAVRAPAEWTKA